MNDKSDIPPSDAVYELALQEMHSQVQELQRSAELRHNLADQMRDLEALLAAREASLAEAHQGLLSAENLMREARLQAAYSRQQAEEAQLKFTGAQERIAFLERALERAEAEADAQRELAANMRAENLQASMDSAAANSRLESLQKRHEELRSETARAQTELEQGRREYERQISTLRSLYDAVQLKLATIESVRTHLASQADGLRRENISLKQMLEKQQRQSGSEAEKWRIYAQSLETILAENGLSVHPTDQAVSESSNVTRLSTSS